MGKADRVCKKFLIKWLLFVCGCILVGFLISVALYSRLVEVRVFVSPKGYGTAYFLKASGLDDTTIQLYVKDKDASSRKIRVGRFSKDTGLEPPDVAVWSQDGSVIAVKRGENDVTQNILWTHAYDFLHHENLSSISFQADPVRSDEISRLVAERGGGGTQLVLSNENVHRNSRVVWPWDGF
jgi:hypothetical protein